MPGDPPPEDVRLSSERYGSLLEERETFELTVADMLPRSFTRVESDALSDDRLGRLEASLAAACAMLDVHLAELKERVARLEELLS